MNKTLPLALLLVAGCPDPTPPTPPTPPACEASTDWITSPTMPSEVPEAESFCDFYQFSWKWFLAQVSPDPANGMPRFMENRVYQPSGGTGQCALEALTGVAGVQASLAPRTIKAQDFEEVQADSHALYDRNGNVVHYNAFYSQALCDSTDAGFAPGTLEVKAAWMKLEAPSSDYFTIAVMMGGSKVHLGLVGLHLAIWTPNHPEMIWASWERKHIAPLCNGQSEGTEWALASADAAACLVANKTEGSGPPPEACASFGFNTPDALPSGDVPPTNKPNNVCREYAYGNQPGEAVNGNDNAENIASIAELNVALVGADGLLTRLPANNPMHIWSHYEMVGGLWTKDGAASGALPVPSKQGPADPNSPQRGSLELANMALETFQQGDESYVPNCFGCHKYDPAKPLDVSHIQSKLIVSE
jgi:hypothetical protein